jgi:hypothetical protein
MIDLTMIKEYAEVGSPHPCNSCFMCQPTGFKNDEDIKQCNERIALFGIIELKVRAYLTIQSYISKCDYTWSVETLLKEFGKYLNNYYVSFTAKDCIENNKQSFQILSTLVA